MKRMGILPFVCAAALVVGCNSNNNKTAENRNEPAAVGTAGEADRTAVHDSEKDFITKQLADGDAEVELGRMAAQKAVNPEVKRFAQMMVDDHTKALDDLKSSAGTHNITWPTTLDADHKKLSDRLSKLSGAAFDREYMQAMVDGHKKVAADLRKESQSGTDADLKAWAGKTLPTVEAHLKQAEAVNRTVHSSTATH